MKNQKHNHAEIRIGCKDCLNDNKPQHAVSTASHTPTPFNVSVGIANADLSDDQREYIVRAVNSHQSLVNGLYELRDRLVMGQDHSGNSEINQDEIEMINVLLAKAEGK